VESDADVVAAQRRGTVVFAGLELEVGEGVLVPRAETELVAAVAIEIALATPRAPIVVDVGTGAANLACAIATRDPRARVIAIDVAPAAVALARRNVERLGLDARVTVTLGDALAPLEALGLADAAVDLVVCNPPYISTRRLDERADLTRREPREAFDGGRTASRCTGASRATPPGPSRPAGGSRWKWAWVRPIRSPASSRARRPSSRRASPRTRAANLASSEPGRGASPDERCP
jgi:SAM-dependent methyltransferase